MKINTLDQLFDNNMYLQNKMYYIYKNQNRLQKRNIVYKYSLLKQLLCLKFNSGGSVAYLRKVWEVENTCEYIELEYIDYNRYRKVFYCQITFSEKDYQLFAHLVNAKLQIESL